MRWKYAFLILAFLNIVLLVVIAAPRLLSAYRNFTHVLYNEPIIGHIYSQYGFRYWYVQIGSRHFITGHFDREFALASTMLRLIRDDTPYGEWHCLTRYVTHVWACDLKAVQVDGLIFIRSNDAEWQTWQGWVFAREFNPLWEFYPISLLDRDELDEFYRLRDELGECEEHAWINMYELDGVTFISSVRRIRMSLRHV